MLLNRGVRLQPPFSPYSNNFNSTETPLTQGGIWVGGNTQGLDWLDLLTSGGLCYGTGDNKLTGHFDDAIGHLRADLYPFGPNHYAQATFYVEPGYAPVDPAFHELELWTRMSITAHGARGYEVSCSITEQMIHVVPWNGALDDFGVSIADVAFSPAAGATTRVRAEMVGTLLRVLVDGVQVISVSDSQWTDGQPGIGAWAREGTTRNFYAFADVEFGRL